MSNPISVTGFNTNAGTATIAASGAIAPSNLMQISEILLKGIYAQTFTENLSGSSSLSYQLTHNPTLSAFLSTYDQVFSTVLSLSPQIIIQEQIDIYLGDSRFGYITEGSGINIYPNQYLYVQFQERLVPPAYLPDPTYLPIQSLTLKAKNALDWDIGNVMYNQSDMNVLSDGSILTKRTVVLGIMDPSDGKFHSMWDIHMPIPQYEIPSSILNTQIVWVRRMFESFATIDSLDPFMSYVRKLANTQSTSESVTASVLPPSPPPLPPPPSGNIQFVAATTANGSLGGSSSFTVTLSQTPNVGDILVIMATVSDGATNTVGYTSLGLGTTNLNGQTASYTTTFYVDGKPHTTTAYANYETGYIVIGSPAPATLTFTTNTTQGVWEVIIFEYSGINVSSPIDKHGLTVATNNAATTINSPTVTPSQTNDMVIVFGGDDATSLTTTPSLSLITYMASTNTVAGYAAYSGSGSIYGTSHYNPSAGTLGACAIILLNP